MRGLMLDVDGVLISGRPGDGQHWSTGLEADLGITRVALRDAFFQTDWPEIVTGAADLMPRLAAALDRIGTKVTAEALVTYWFAQDSRIMKDVLDDVGRARQAGLRVYLCTNQEHLRAHHLIDEMGLRDHVDGIVYSAALGTKKPEADFFTAAEAQVGLPGSDLLLVDDTAANVVAARLAGWRAVHWTGQSTLKDILKAESNGD